LIAAGAAWSRSNSLGPVRFRAFIALALAFGALLVATPAQAAGSSRIAAVQVALQARGFYEGTIDGYYGAGTQQAVVRFQRSRGLLADGIAGRRTRRSLGRYGRPLLGRRVLVQGRVGFDVSQLQFLLAWHGFPSGSFDGGFGGRTDHALRRFQRWARLGADGVAGPATFAALRTPPPRSPLGFVRPLQTGLGDRFGPRGPTFHTGIDFPARAGTGVAAARYGRVSYAAWMPGGWGYLVSIAHGHGVRTMYAHLSRIDVRVGARVGAGHQIGLVGSTGHSTGSHLHFEVRVRGAAVDPLPAFG
jgi:murein DD-endopeptidase MepM/ murein hydrolase activator NlpD